MSVSNPPLELLNRAIQSIAAQVYDNWELCIASDPTSDPAVMDCIERWTTRDPRIRFVSGAANSHISPATNTAAELAVGDYIVLMDQNDVVTEDALGEVAIHLADNPGTDLLYSDDDKVDPGGQRFDPQFKPDWSPELLLSYMYFSHLLVLRRQLFLQAGGFRQGFYNSQDYDLALRATELTHHVGHIPRILYHRGLMPGSMDASVQSSSSGGQITLARPEHESSTRPAGWKPAYPGGLRAIQEALERRGIPAEAVPVEAALEAPSPVFSTRFADDGPRVAIVILTKNGVASLRGCLDSLRKTTYRNYEVVIIDNESDDPAALSYLNEIQHKVLRIENSGDQFSLASLSNRAVGEVTAEYVLFLNNNAEVVKPEWLSQMAGLLGLPGVGAVGARLISGDRSIEHAGIVHVYYDGMAGPAVKLLPATNSGYLNYPIVTRNYSAVTSDCMLTPRNLFLEVGGFDEKTFRGAFTAVEYCHALRSGVSRRLLSQCRTHLERRAALPGLRRIRASGRPFAGYTGAFQTPTIIESLPRTRALRD
jgi:GT2 family glycosyltransferase